MILCSHPWLDCINQSCIMLNSWSQMFVFLRLNNASFDYVFVCLFSPSKSRLPWHSDSPLSFPSSFSSQSRFLVTRLDQSLKFFWQHFQKWLAFPSAEDQQCTPIHRELCLLVSSLLPLTTIRSWLHSKSNRSTSLKLPPQRSCLTLFTIISEIGKYLLVELSSDVYLALADLTKLSKAQLDLQYFSQP